MSQCALLSSLHGMLTQAVHSWRGASSAGSWGTTKIPAAWGSGRPGLPHQNTIVYMNPDIPSHALTWSNMSAASQEASASSKKVARPPPQAWPNTPGKIDCARSFDDCSQSAGSSAVPQEVALPGPSSSFRESSY